MITIYEIATGKPLRNVDEDYKLQEGEASTRNLYEWNLLEGRLIDGVWTETFIDTRTPEQILEAKTKRAIEIDFEYTKKISDLMEKHTEKFIEALENGETYVIPQIAKDQKQALKDECNAKIAALGITDYTYRQSVPKLAKF